MEIPIPMPKPLRNLSALLLALLLLGAGPVWAGAECGSPCCASKASAAAAGPPHGVLARACCCAGATAPAPCNLEQGRASRAPVGVLGSAPELRAPSQVPSATGIGVGYRSVSFGPRLARVSDPLAGAPPGPVYLRHASFLC